MTRPRALGLAPAVWRVAVEETLREALSGAASLDADLAAALEYAVFPGGKPARSSSMISPAWTIRSCAAAGQRSMFGSAVAWRSSRASAC